MENKLHFHFVGNEKRKIKNVQQAIFYLPEMRLQHN